MDKIQDLSLPEKARVIIISDIHGELALLQELLEKVQYQKGDYLIINGDLGEKGSDSKGVIRYVMNLQQQNANVFVTEGNCEAIIDELLRENPKLLNYLNNRPNTLYNEWLHEIGYEKNEETTVQHVKDLLLTHYKKEIKWLEGLSTAIETEDYIFVHAGLEDIENWKVTDREQALTIPAFLEKSHRADKYVVVGHWPLINYSRDIPSHNPIINQEQKVIAMDGGNVIKASGQLNAFIINRSPLGDTFSYETVDELNYQKANQDDEGDPNMVRAIHYPDYHIEPQEKGEHFTLCKHPSSGRMLYVKNEYIIDDEEGHQKAKSDISCAQLSVKEGDLVSIIDDSCTGYTLVKKGGDMGWIKKGIVSDRV